MLGLGLPLHPTLFGIISVFTLFPLLQERTALGLPLTPLLGATGSSSTLSCYLEACHSVISYCGHRACSLPVCLRKA
jgi:hypothetical protein